MDDKLKAMKVSSKVIGVLARIGYIAMIVVMSISAVSLIFMAVTGGKTAAVYVAGINFVIADGLLEAPRAVAASCAELLVMAAFLFVIFLLTYRIFHDMSVTGMPLNEKYVKTIKTIGLLVAIMTVVMGMVDAMVVSYAGVETLGIDTEAPGVVAGVIIFCFAYIYDYGCALVKQPDSTL